MTQLPPFASYRDPASKVYSTGDEVVRVFDPAAAAGFKAAHEDGILRDLVGEGLLIDYEVEGEADTRVVTQKIPFVTYPSEWTFGMLKEAGLLTLEVSRRLWVSGFHLRDASAYNVVFDGNSPRLVDLGSVGLGSTPLWTAYGQFCDHFLNPLLIEAKTGVSFRDLWTLEGISVATTRNVLHGIKGWGSGTFRNVVLRDRLEASLEKADARTRRATRSELSLPANRIDGLMGEMVRRLEALEAGRGSHWATYSANNSYDETTEAARVEMIREFSTKSPPGTALDIGANTGRHAEVLADYFQRVIALDSDSSAMEAARARFQAKNIGERVHPLVADIADPTPARGLMNQECSSLLDRLAGSGAVIWMAVIHHLAIGRSIPLDAVATLAARLSPRHLIEFVDLDDPMSQLLAASKGDEHHPYGRTYFEKAFGEHFRIEYLGKTLETRPVFELTRR